MRLNDLFLNVKTNKSLQNNGFVKIPFYNTSDLTTLSLFINNLNIEYNIKDIDYHVSLLSENKSYRKQIDTFITKLLNNKCDSLFNKHYSILLSNLIIKNPDTGEVPLHQNWSFVDEYQHRSYTIWIPLVDTDESNGTLEFIAGSHNLFYDEKRGHNTPYFFLEEEDRLKQLLHPIHVKAGEALIFDDAILHYSKPNTTKQPRIAIQAIIIPENTRLLHYHYHKGCLYDKIYTLTVDKTFFDTMEINLKDKTSCNRFKKRKISPKEWELMKQIYDENLTSLQL